MRFSEQVVSRSSQNQPLVLKVLSEPTSSMTDDACFDGWLKEYVNRPGECQIGGEKLDFSNLVGAHNAGRAAYEKVVDRLFELSNLSDVGRSAKRRVCETVARNLLMNGVAGADGMAFLDRPPLGYAVNPGRSVVNVVPTDYGFLLHKTSLCRTVTLPRENSTAEYVAAELGAHALETDYRAEFHVETENCIVNSIANIFRGAGKREYQVRVLPTSFDITTPFKEVRDQFVASQETIWDRLFAFFAELFDRPRYVFYQPCKDEKTDLANSRPILGGDPVPVPAEASKNGNDLVFRPATLFGKERVTRLTTTHRLPMEAESRKIVLAAGIDIEINPGAPESKKTQLAELTTADQKQRDARDATKLNATELFSLRDKESVLWGAVQRHKLMLETYVDTCLKDDFVGDNKRLIERFVKASDVERTVGDQFGNLVDKAMSDSNGNQTSALAQVDAVLRKELGLDAAKKPVENARNIGNETQDDLPPDDAAGRALPVHLRDIDTSDLQAMLDFVEMLEVTLSLGTSNTEKFEEGYWKSTQGVPHHERRQTLQEMREGLEKLESREVVLKNAETASQNDLVRAMEALQNGNVERAIRRMWVGGPAASEDLQDVAFHRSKDNKKPVEIKSPVALYIKVLADMALIGAELATMAHDNAQTFEGKLEELVTQMLKNGIVSHSLVRSTLTLLAKANKTEANNGVPNASDPKASIAIVDETVQEAKKILESLEEKLRADGYQEPEGGNSDNVKKIDLERERIRINGFRELILV
ncbi:hypothetical protein PQQ99_36195 [Paraburkholderia sediminicola]|uniref:hypothetical protein n=1 Tax=Paraburkholderia sediminicola TaxID=458836 RepID=UPI0038BCA87A